ncbi:MAG: efflux RND transporter periplasmic adaptor subunit [Deltaproteobacteria bacterium]|nr:efflux RND transporter periplasmic adaptor subunit [Deltaproteobacteria bacterium]
MMILNGKNFLSRILIIGVLTAFVSSNPFTYAEDKSDGHDETEEVHNHGDEHAEEDIVKMSAEELKEFGIVVKAVGPSVIQMHTDLSGEIKPDPRKIAHMIPRFDGIVKKVHKTIGDRVKKGDVLAVIESNESLMKYEVTSAIDGTVIDMHMTPGELVNGGSNHDITVANLKTVWAELSVYQKDLSIISIGQMVIILAGHEIYEAKGKISYISPIIDEATRTATARVSLDNSTGKWKPGMFVTAEVLTLEQEVPLAVAKNAIQSFEGQAVVFVQDKEGFRPQPVTVGLQNDKVVEILSGLHAGETYIAKGAFTIKAELMKESFGGGHGH